MLQITIPAIEAYELWDEEKEEFIPMPARKEQILQLEHSLIALSKWESKWCKPFHSAKEKTIEETIDYIRCMTLNKNVDPEVYERIGEDNMKLISDYIFAPMTATTITEEKNSKYSRKIVTAELIYCWMFSQHIPLECEKWHLNRLITLIKVCAIENSPPKKRSNKEIMSRNAALNAARRKKLNTKG